MPSNVEKNQQKKESPQLSDRKIQSNF